MIAHLHHSQLGSKKTKTLWLGGSFSFGLDEPKLKILKYAPVMYYIETMERSLSWLGNN